MKYLVLSFIILFTLPSSGSAGYKEDFERGFLTKPWAGEQVEENQCIACHASDQMKPEFQEIVDAWQPSLHAQNRISCENCHGGDPKDADFSMSRERGFVGTPQFKEVPEFCGKCHIGILSRFIESGHGKALKASKKAPNCVTCHGSHNIKKASIEIINPQLCTKCHSYERAKTMKQALFMIENRIYQLDKILQELKREGIYPEAEEKRLFSIQAEFRALFHTVDINLVKERTDEYATKLDQLEKDMQATIREIGFRKNFSAFFLFTFAGMFLVTFLISRSHDD